MPASFRSGSAAARPVVLGLTLPGDLETSDNMLFVGWCQLEFTSYGVTLRGRRYTSLGSRRSALPAYKALDWLVHSFIGIPLAPFVILYINLANLQLTRPASVTLDLDRIGDVSCERDMLSFAVLTPEGRIEHAMFGLSSSEEDVRRMAQLLQSTGRRVSRMPLP